MWMSGQTICDVRTNEPIVFLGCGYDEKIEDLVTGLQRPGEKPFDHLDGVGFFTHYEDENGKIWSGPDFRSNEEIKNIEEIIIPDNARPALWNDDLKNFEKERIENESKSKC
tara:strand:- start:397 stop:732 length:336 start_codon:yes stop_codon:yes gene_type:complete